MAYVKVEQIILRETELKMDPEMELTPSHHLMWDIYGTGARGGVDPQKVQNKYGSGNWSRDRVGTLGLIWIKNLDSSTSKMYN